MTLPPVLDLIAWNCYVANDDSNVLHQLRAWVREYAPDVFVLCEASTHADVLGNLDGYTLLQETPPRGAGRGDDTGDVAILVADSHTIKHRWVARMTRWWLVLRYRRRHQPHRYEVALVDVRGQTWRICGAHPPTHGLDGPNRVAFGESARFFRRWLRRTLTRPSIVVGDLNETAGTLAAWFGPKFRVFGAGIDCAVTRGVRGGETERLGKGGSDHHGRRYQFEAK